MNTREWFEDFLKAQRMPRFEKSVYVVVRMARLMEDEGREDVRIVFNTKAQAEAWREAQTYYFTKHDYYVVEAEDGRDV